MGVTLSTLVGWVAVLGLFGGYAFREWTKSQQAQVARATQQRLHKERPAPVQRKEIKEAKAKRPAKPAAKPAAKAPTPAAPAPQPAVTYTYSSDDDAASNREFARQLASVKQGTKFTGKTKDETRQKSVKQSRAEEIPRLAEPAPAVSAPSSTAGIDADDDQSPAASPVLGAVAGNVDDMLEKPAPGPSVLRLTGTEEKKSAKDKKPKAAPAPVETKKQRQNRKKAEQAKIEREEAEADRKVKLEAQRRTARVAEGRAAKDGSGFVAAQANASNTWTANGAKPAAAAASNGFIPAQPLDTFESNAVVTDASKSSVPSFDKSEDWMSSLPSEEEQMEMLRKEDDDSWSTVKTKTRKPKAAASAETVPAETAVAKTAAPVVGSSAAASRPAKAVAQKSAFAALSTEDAADEEQEWDV